MAKKIVVCDSGEIGMQQRFKSIYDDYEDFLVFNKMFNIAKRLGYDSPKKLWDDNPIVQASSKPSDFKIVKKW